jgi:hypothetical protein
MTGPTGTRLLLAASALVLGIAGAVASFAPHEILSVLGAPAAGALPVVLQLHGAMLLGFAMMNWMAKDSLIGGIYNRPLAIGNLVHFLAGGLAVVKFVVAGNAPPYAMIAAAIYTLFAIAFARILFRSPVAPA